MKDTFSLSLLIIVILMRYYTVLDSFWLADDTQILKYVITHRPWEYFFSSTAFKESGSLSFTPWVCLSFEVDWNIFGLRPSGFYLHHLTALCLVAVCCYITLRLWFSSAWSLFGGVVFAISSPFAEFAQFLMVRHYAEGLIFALLALYCFVVGIRNDKLPLSIFGALLYLLACSAKEIYAPLVFFVVILPEAKWKKRLLHAMPFFCAATFYVFWRWHMLGMLTGGYGLPLVWPQDAVLLPQRIADAMGGAADNRMSWWRCFIGASSLVSVIVLFKVNKKRLFYIIGCSPLVLLPIIPVSPIMSTRYVWLLTFCWIVVNIVVFNDILLKLKGRLFAKVAVYCWSLILLFSFFYASSIYMEYLKSTADRHKVEGIFFLQTGTMSDLLVNPTAPAWYYEGLTWLRKQVLHLPEGPALNFDPNLFCLKVISYEKYKNIWRYNVPTKTLISYSGENYFNSNCKDITERVRLEAPLSLSIKYEKSTLGWEFGPYKNGSYDLVFGPGGESIRQMPNNGRRFVGLNEDVRFRLRYSSPEGWRTYSPLLVLSIADDKGSIDWKR